MAWVAGLGSTHALRGDRLVRVAELARRAHVLIARARIAVDRSAVRARTRTSEHQAMDENTVTNGRSFPHPPKIPSPECTSSPSVASARSGSEKSTVRKTVRDGMKFDKSGRATRALRARSLARVTELVHRAHVLPARACIAVDRRAISARTRTSEDQAMDKRSQLKEELPAVLHQGAPLDHQMPRITTRYYYCRKTAVRKQLYWHEAVQT